MNFDLDLTTSTEERIIHSYSSYLRLPFEIIAIVTSFLDPLSRISFFLADPRLFPAIGKCFNFSDDMKFLLPTIEIENNEDEDTLNEKCFLILKRIISNFGCIKSVYRDFNQTHHKPFISDFQYNSGIKRLSKELTKSNCKSYGFRYLPVLPHLVVAELKGPQLSPYVGGVFYLTIKINHVNYPFEAPKVRFLTKIIHPNISKIGNVYYPLEYHWNPTFTIGKVLENLISLLIEPSPLIPPLNEKAAYLYKDLNRETYFKLVQQHTAKYALT